MKLLVTPYTTPAASTLYLSLAARPAAPLRLTLALSVGGLPLRVFSVPAAANTTDEHLALADEVSKVPFLKASVYDQRFVVAATPGRNLTSGVLNYG